MHTLIVGSGYVKVPAMPANPARTADTDLMLADLALLL